MRAPGRKLCDWRPSLVNRSVTQERPVLLHNHLRCALCLLWRTLEPYSAEINTRDYLLIICLVDNIYRAFLCCALSLFHKTSPGSDCSSGSRWCDIVDRGSHPHLSVIVNNYIWYKVLAPDIGGKSDCQGCSANLLTLSGVSCGSRIQWEVCWRRGCHMLAVGLALPSKAFSVQCVCPCRYDWNEAVALLHTSSRSGYSSLTAITGHFLHITQTFCCLTWTRLSCSSSKIYKSGL